MKKFVAVSICFFLIAACAFAQTGPQRHMPSEYLLCLDSGDAGADLVASLASRTRSAAWDNYRALWTQGVQQSQLLVIGIGCEPPDGDWLSCRLEELEGHDADTGAKIDYPVGMILVCKPGAGMGTIIHKTTQTGVTSQVITTAVTKYSQTFTAPRGMQMYGGQMQQYSNMTYGAGPMMGSGSCGPGGCGPASGGIFGGLFRRR